MSFGHELENLFLPGRERNRGIDAFADEENIDSHKTSLVIADVIYVWPLSASSMAVTSSKAAGCFSR